MAELLRLSFLTRTPILALTLLQASLVSMTSYYGLETALRAKQVLLPIVLFMQFLVGFGFWARRYWPHVSPILEYGVGPVWHYSFPLITTVPYGELVVFLFLFPFIRDRVNRSAIAATLTGGGLLVFIAFMAVLVIGPANLANSALPYYTTVRSITFGDVVQRLDGVIVPMLAFCAYAKASTYMKGSAYGFAHMLGARRPASLAFPLTFLAAGMASSMAVSWGQHLDVGLQIVPYALHLPLQFMIPVLLWLLAEFRTRGQSMRPPRPLTMDTPPKWTRIVTTILALLLWVPTLFPKMLASTPITTYILRPLATYIGSPVARLLGGQPMQK